MGRSVRTGRRRPLAGGCGVLRPAAQLAAGAAAAGRRRGHDTAGAILNGGGVWVLLDRADGELPELARNPQSGACMPTRREWQARGVGQRSDVLGGVRRIV